MKQAEHNEKTLPRGFGHTPNSNPFDHVPEHKGPGGPGKGAPGRPGPGGPGRGGPRMAMVAEKPKSAKATLLRLLQYFGREKRLLYLMVLTVALVTVMSLCFPALQGEVIDRITKRDWDALPRLIGAMLAVIGVNVLGTFGQSLISAFLSQNIVRRLRQDLFEKIVRLPIQYMDTHSNGDVMSRMVLLAADAGHDVYRGADRAGHQETVRHHASGLPQAQSGAGPAERSFRRNDHRL